MWGRGLKSNSTLPTYIVPVSPPVWGRGLKLSGGVTSIVRPRSPPVWGRGLKLVIVNAEGVIEIVAPCVGAWVEIEKLSTSTAAHARRPLCGGVG